MADSTIKNLTTATDLLSSDSYVIERGDNSNANVPQSLLNDEFKLYENISTSSYVVLNKRGERIIMDVNTSSGSLNMNATPVSGAVVDVVVDGDASINNLVVSGNGNNVFGDTTFNIDMNNSHVSFIFNGTEWLLGTYSANPN